MIDENHFRRSDEGERGSDRGAGPAGESFEVVNLGRPTVHMVAAALRRVLKWDDHLAAAIPARGHSAEEAIGADRDGRF